MNKMSIHSSSQEIQLQWEKWRRHTYWNRDYAIDLAPHKTSEWRLIIMHGKEHCTHSSTRRTTQAVCCEKSFQDNAHQTTSNLRHYKVVNALALPCVLLTHTRLGSVFPRVHLSTTEQALPLPSLRCSPLLGPASSSSSSLSEDEEVEEGSLDTWDTPVRERGGREGGREGEREGGRWRERERIRGEGRARKTGCYIQHSVIMTFTLSIATPTSY